MSTYLERAKDWIEKDFEVSDEAIEQLIQKFKTQALVEQNLSDSQRTDLRDTSSFLNEALKERLGVTQATPAPSETSCVEVDILFDSSPLGSEAEPALSKSEGADLLEAMKNSGLFLSATELSEI